MAVDPKDLSIHDEVVVETEVDGALVSVAAFVTNVLAGELWLATRLPDPRLLSFEEGQPIHLSFDRGGQLIVGTEFLRRLGSNTRLGMEKSRVFAVRRPQGLENVQRRAHVRVDLERMVRIRSMGSLGDHVGTGKTVNIGAGGVQFTTEVPLMFGDQLKIALVLTSRDIVVARGTVVRIEDHVVSPLGGSASDAPPTVLSRVAMRFDKISEVDQERISLHILAAHRKLSAKAAAPGDAPPPSIHVAPAEPVEPGPGSAPESTASEPATDGGS
jgi:hypothetical protein